MGIEEDIWSHEKDIEKLYYKFDSLLEKLSNLEKIVGELRKDLENYIQQTEGFKNTSDQ